MIRIPLILAGMAMVGAAATVPAAAQDAYAVRDLNMRAGPGPEYPVVTVIRLNATVEILGCTGSWCDVVWDGYRGWSYSPYLAYAGAGTPVIVPEARARVEVPAVRFEGGPYPDKYYRDRQVYEERRNDLPGNLAAGAASGAIAGAALGGPVGAAVGGVAGAAIGGAILPPERVRTYVVEHPTEPVLLEREVVVGTAIPDPVVVHPIPDYEYRYAIVNDQPVLIDPASRRIVYVYR